MGFQVVEIARRDLVFRWRSPEGTLNFSFCIKGIARWDSKLFEIARRDLVFRYWSKEVARRDLVFQL